MRASLRFASAFFALFLVASAAFAEDYAVKLSRPDKPGFKYKITSAAMLKTDRSLRQGEKLLKSDSSVMTVDFAAEMTVLEVNDHGGVTKCSLKISKVTVTAGGAARELLPADTEVIASVEKDEEVFRINGAVVSPDVSQALTQVVSLSRGGATDDDIFGTTERKKIGDSWPINSATMAADLSKDGPLVKPEDVTGTVKLVGLAKIGNIPCLEVAAEMSLKATSLASASPAPKGYTFSTGSMKFSYSGKFPIDPLTRCVDESAGMTVTIVFLGDAPASGGPGQTMGIRRTRKKVETSEPLN